MFQPIFFISLSVVIFGVLTLLSAIVSNTPPSYTPPISPTPTVAPSPTPTVLKTPPQQKILDNDYHIYQTFNNCGPAAFSMTLSYFGINLSQQELGQQLRPYQNPKGDNDDKSVTLDELAKKAKEYDLVPFHRPNGNIELIKLFITHDIPVLARTWTKEGEDIGHYRVVKGYDETTQEIIQDDSLQGKNLRFQYETFSKLWQGFNFEYLVLVPKEKQKITEVILKEDKDEKRAWEKAVHNAQNQLAENPSDIYARFNLSVALYNIGDYQRSVQEFEQIEHLLPFRTLWYQIEPILSYYELGDYQRVFQITEKVLNNYNRAFSELYMIRGNIYLQQGEEDAASAEFENAVLYNQNFAQKIPKDF